MVKEYPGRTSYLPPRYRQAKVNLIMEFLEDGEDVKDVAQFFGYKHSFELNRWLKSATGEALHLPKKWEAKLDEFEYLRLVLGMDLDRVQDEMGMTSAFGITFAQSATIVSRAF